LKALAERRDGYEVRLRLTGEEGRLTRADLDTVCADGRERETFLSGPEEMIDVMLEHWESHADPDRLHLERFQPKIDAGEPGEGGEIKFLKSETTAESDGSKPILVAGEEAGLELPFGCREGICHTCIGKLCTGQVRDMRNGKVYGTEGEMIRTCISAPEGAVEIEL
ncbi:MAG: flavin reductase family protein, partial [Thermoleophilaceae bacterium]